MTVEVGDGRRSWRLNIEEAGDAKNWGEERSRIQLFGEYRSGEYARPVIEGLGQCERISPYCRRTEARNMGHLLPV